MFAPAIALGLVLAAPTNLTFVRHAETVANRTGRYNARTLDSFSTEGERQIEALPNLLPSQPRFDRILVSPSPRVLRTIAPYLRRTGQRATVWPLLYECCTGRRPKGAHPTRFVFGQRINLPADVASLFVILPGEDRLPVSPDYNAGLAQVAASVQEFRSRFSGGTVLIAGHSGQGGHFLHELSGKWIRVQNARPIKLRVP